MSYTDLNRGQKEALKAMMLPTNRTLADVAREIGKTERTIQTYMADSNFKKELANLEGQVINLATRRLLGLVDLSISTLEEIIKTGSETNKRLAAQAVINSLQSFKEFSDFNSRLSDLEQELSNV